MKNSKGQCAACRDTGYVTYADENCTTTCYCDCDYGTMAYIRDEELTVDSKFDFTDSED